MKEERVDVDWLKQDLETVRELSSTRSESAYKRVLAALSELSDLRKENEELEEREGKALETVKRMTRLYKEADGELNVLRTRRSDLEHYLFTRKKELEQKDLHIQKLREGLEEIKREGFEEYGRGNSDAVYEIAKALLALTPESTGGEGPIKGVSYQILAYEHVALKKIEKAALFHTKSCIHPGCGVCEALAELDKVRGEKKD